jgi:hypothetical protein
MALRIWITGGVVLGGAEFAGDTEYGAVVRYNAVGKFMETEDIHLDTKFNCQEIKRATSS